MPITNKRHPGFSGWRFFYLANLNNICGGLLIEGLNNNRLKK